MTKALKMLNDELSSDSEEVNRLCELKTYFSFKRVSLCARGRASKSNSGFEPARQWDALHTFQLTCFDRQLIMFMELQK